MYFPSENWNVLSQQTEMLINFNGFHFFCQDMFDKKKNKENSVINVVVVFRPNILLITFQVSRTLPLFS